MQVALLSYNARPGDAIGNNLADKLSFFLARGAVVRVFLEDVRDLHPAVTSASTQLTEVNASGPGWNYLCACDLVLAEYPHHYALLDFLPLLAGGKPRLLVDYHGVTPPELWAEHQREVLERGVAQRGLLWCADRILVHSRCMAAELQRELGLPAERLMLIGFPVVESLPLAPGGRGVEGEVDMRSAGKAAPLPPAPSPKRRGGAEAPLPLAPSPKRRGGAEEDLVSPLAPGGEEGDGEKDTRSAEDFPASTPPLRFGEGAGGRGAATEETAFPKSDFPSCTPPLRFGEGAGGRGLAGVEPSPTTAAPLLRGERRESTESQVLLFVGRLAPNKNVPLLVEALHHLRDLQPPVHLVIVGDERDVYAEQAALCRQKAEHLGLSQRVHLLGPLMGARLQQVYASASVFVTASLWESFCLPVVEAMAAGVPVVVSRSFALPETLGCAGLTFEPGDAVDLARQVRRVLESKQERSAGVSLTPRKRIAVVTPRHGTQYVCGITRSVRSIVGALVQAQHQVEVFSTCSLSESDWRNDLRPGTIRVDGAAVHLHPIDPWDRRAYLQALGVLGQSSGPASAATEQAFLAHGLRSSALLAALAQRSAEFDAILIGPYLSSLCVEAARLCPEKTLLIPCLHDEPLARLRCWREGYRHVAGLLLHSREEGELAAELGLGQPAATVIGSLVHNTDHYSEEMLQARLDQTPRTIVYCGRYSAEKNLPRLLDWARRYSDEYPGRFTFLFTGQGYVGIPEEQWAKNLGFVSEMRKREVMARADALVTLSENESLSLAALEAWALATPVLASAGCRVLAGHIERSGGGRTVSGYEDFVAALNDLWDRPAHWHSLGCSGQTYVRAHYQDRAAFTARLEQVIADVAVPLHRHMSQSGRKRAQEFSGQAWRTRLASIVEELLQSPPRQHHEEVEVRRRSATLRVPADLGSTLAAVRVFNHGTLPLLAEGPTRTVLSVSVRDGAGNLVVGPLVAALPRPVLPGSSVSAAVPVPVPRRPGTYRIVYHGRRCGSAEQEPLQAAVSSARLVVVVPATAQADSCCGGLLHAAQHDLADADRLQRLPDDYLDVSTGTLKKIKLVLKRKLLGNFKTAYVDVLSRQQSAFNRQVVSTLQHLLECVATLDHALRQGQKSARRQKKSRPRKPQVKEKE